VPDPANSADMPPPLEPGFDVAELLGPPAPPPPYPVAVSRDSPRSPTTTLNTSFALWMTTFDLT
jgi:hypothetical protein